MRFFNFGKQKNNDHLPEEVKTFTAEEQRERLGIAWLVGIISLLVVLFITSVLYFGGRWAYNKISHKDNKTTTSTTNTTNNDKKDQKSATGQKPKTGTTTPVPAPTPTPPVNPTPITGPTGPDLPHTGPDSDE